MKNVSIFEPQIKKHYAYKKKNMYDVPIPWFVHFPRPYREMRVLKKWNYLSWFFEEHWKFSIV